MKPTMGRWGTIEGKDKIAAMRVAKKLIKGKKALQKEDWNPHHWLSLKGLPAVKAGHLLISRGT